MLGGGGVRVCRLAVESLTVMMMLVILYFQRGDLKTIGLLVATSIVQGGPGLPVLSPAVYRYISSGDDAMADSLVPNPRSLIETVGVVLIVHIDFKARP